MNMLCCHNSLLSLLSLFSVHQDKNEAFLLYPGGILHDLASYCCLKHEDFLDIFKTSDSNEVLDGFSQSFITHVVRSLNQYTAEIISIYYRRLPFQKELKNDETSIINSYLCNFQSSAAALVGREKKTNRKSFKPEKTQSNKINLNEVTLSVYNRIFLSNLYFIQIATTRLMGFLLYKVSPVSSFGLTKLLPATATVVNSSFATECLQLQSSSIRQTGDSQISMSAGDEDKPDLAKTGKNIDSNLSSLPSPSPLSSSSNFLSSLLSLSMFPVSTPEILNYLQMQKSGGLSVSNVVQLLMDGRISTLIDLLNEIYVTGGAPTTTTMKNNKSKKIRLNLIITRANDGFLNHFLMFSYLLCDFLKSFELLLLRS